MQSLAARLPRARRSMPTMYRWDYDDPDEADPVLQGAYAGDIAHDDGLGEDGVIKFLEGAYLNMTFELEGEKVTKNRTFGHIRALQSRLTATTERPQRAAPTGRPGQALGGLFQFLGASGAAANPTTPAAKAQSKKAFGKTPAKKNAPAKAAAPAAAGGKRKERERPPPAEEEEEQEAEAEDDDRAAAGEAGGSGVNSLAQLGADYAGSDDSEAEEPSEKKQKAAAGAVSVRKMDLAARMQYVAGKYGDRKTKLQANMMDTYGPWLKLEKEPNKAGGNARGWCCVVCIDSRCVPARLPSPF